MIVGNTLFFAANDATNGFELWKSDGTTAGTVMVKDINPGSADSLFHYSESIAIGNTFYFQATDAQSCELWKSDGTTAGTVIVNSAGSHGWGGDTLTSVFHFISHPLQVALTQDGLQTEHRLEPMPLTDSVVLIRLLVVGIMDRISGCLLMVIANISLLWTLL